MTTPALALVSDLPADVVKIPVQRASIFGDVPRPELCKETAALPLTYAGFAERVMKHWGDQLAYNTSSKTWLVYNGAGLWVERRGLIQHMVMATARSVMVHEADYAEFASTRVAELREHVDNAVTQGMPAGAVSALNAEMNAARDSVRRELEKFNEKLENYRDLVGFVLGALEESLTVDESRWDHHKNLVNVKNGVYDVARGWLREHRADDFMTMQIPVEYHPDAASSALDKALEHYDRNGSGYSDHLLRWFGYSLTGIMDAKTFLSLYGARDSAKSTLSGALWEAMGGGTPTSYAASVRPEDLFIRHFGAAETQPHLDRCRGKRLVMISEAEHGRLASDLLKAITGEDPITTRGLREQGGTWVPQFKITFIGQGEIQFDTSDDAIIERLAPVPMTVSLAKVDPQVRRDLNHTPAGHQAVIAAVLHGATEWYVEYKATGDAKAALLIPENVLELKRKYADAVNPLRDWVDAFLVVSDDVTPKGIAEFELEHDNAGRADTSLLLRHYNQWSKAHGGRQMALRQFGKALTAMGCPAIEKPTSFTHTTRTSLFGPPKVKMQGKFREGLRFREQGEWLRWDVYHSDEVDS